MFKDSPPNCNRQRIDRTPLPMDSFDEVLDLSKTNVKKEEIDPDYKSYSMPLTPPHCYPIVPLALRYPVPVMPCNIVTDSSEDTDISNSSPPGATISSTFMLTNSIINANRSGKPTRPFKAYPKELLSGTVPTDIRLGPYQTNNYLEFRQRMLSQIKSVSNKSNANMKRSNSPQQPTSVSEDDLKSSAYWERRRKNNEAAKRSRDARREKEDEIAIRAAYLEQECTRLQNENNALKDEVRHFRYMFCKLGNR